MHVTTFDSDFMMSRMIQTDFPVNISCMYLDKNGLIGYHQAKVPQLLFVLHGEGFVRNHEETYVKVQPGDAVFWEKDEWHETSTSKGLTAVIVESEQLEPSSFMPLQK